MNSIRVVVVLVVGQLWCWSSKPAPFADICKALDRAATVAGSKSANSPVAVKFLELTAMGRMDGLDTALEKELGLRPGELSLKELKVPFVRAYSFRALGRSGASESSDFLANLKVGDIGPDSSQEIWPAAQIALREARLKQMSDASAKVQFLETVLEAGSDAISDAAVVDWGVEQLCDLGSLRSLPIIREAIRKRDPFQSGLQDVTFCETRIQIVARNPDRVKALASVLHTGEGRPSLRVIQWVVSQLRSLGTSEANQELEKFSLAIAALPNTSAEYRELSIFRKDAGAR